MFPPDFVPLYRPTVADPAAPCLAFVGDDLLLDDRKALPAPALLAGLPSPFTDCQMGEQGAASWRLLGWPAGTPLPAGLAQHDLRTCWDLLSPDRFALAVRAKLLLAWDREHRFCGACGTPTAPMDAEAARVCPACRLRAYPRLSPAIMVLIRRGNEVLLATAPHFRTGMYSALAGFVEAGESLEEAIHREVLEEVGLRVANLRWFGSQPWPFPHSMMLAFHADYLGGEIRPQAGEIADARWFPLDSLPALLPRPASIAYQLLQSALCEPRR